MLRQLLRRAAGAPPPSPPPPRLRPRVVVLGSGWGAFAFVRALDRSAVNAVLVSPRNHMLFTPLLTSAASGSLEFRSIAEPVRSSFPHDLTYYAAAAIAIDPQARTVRVRAAAPAAERVLRYDALVLAVGAAPATFGVPGVAEHALFLRDLSDARAIRQRVLRNVEAAAFPGVPPGERARLLSFVVVGGGPTGCELAAELHDLLTRDLGRLYPGVADEAAVTVVEAGPRLLSTFDASLRDYAEARFRRAAVRVRTHAAVRAVSAEGVTLSDGGGGELLRCGLVVWAAGLRPHPLVAALAADGIVRTDAAGRVLVSRYLKALRPRDGSSGSDDADASADDDAAAFEEAPSARCAPLRGVWALGDAAAVGGAPLAATAQVAEQQGDYLGRAFTDALADGGAYTNAPPPKAALAASLDAHIPAVPFEYRHRGSLAMLGMFAGVSDFTAVTPAAGGAAALLRGRRLRGRAAWLLWRSTYLTKLGRWRNRLQVPADWARTALFGRDVTQF